MGSLWTGLLLATFVIAFPAPATLERGRLPENPPRLVESRVDERLARVVAALTGRNATVWCWGAADWRTANFARSPDERLGPWRAYADARPGVINLSPEVCAQLDRLRLARRVRTNDEAADALAWSVAALAHEAQHVAGIRNEAKAECYGLQSIATTARLLGRTATEARYLATLYCGTGTSGSSRRTGRASVATAGASIATEIPPAGRHPRVTDPTRRRR